MVCYNYHTTLLSLTAEKEAINAHVLVDLKKAYKHTAGLSSS